LVPFLYSASDSKLRKKYIQAKAKNFYHSRQHFFARNNLALRTRIKYLILIDREYFLTTSDWLMIYKQP